MTKKVVITIFYLAIFISYSSAQSIETWYANAQKRIDTLRKGNFGIKIIDKNGQPYSGKFSVRMARHEYPFGIAFDLYEGQVFNGNTYTTTATIKAKVDAQIYQSERWYSFLAYSIPVEKNRNYKLTLKFAEIYFDKKGARIFDVFVEGKKFLSDYDVFAEAGGKNIAEDTSIYVMPSDSIINIEFLASLDNAAIKGIEIKADEDDRITRINCGGGALTSKDGHYYMSDEEFFDKNAARYPTEEQWMKSAMQKYFNYGVSGNSFKWSGIQSQHSAPNYQAFDNAVNWTKSIGWELRAHTLLWGGNNYEDDHALPKWIKDLPSAKAITDTCKMRVIREVSHYKGIIKEYDVMNEPLHATYLSSKVGDSINWNCFKWARSADPDANLFINEYNVEYNWGDAKKYRDLINKIKSMGGPVTGVGIQAHFWEGMRPKLTELVSNLNIVAEAGLPIKLTEFDNGDISQEDQAKDFVMVTKIAFSHPSINGIVNWALSDKGAWRKNSGLFTADHKPKLAADTLYYLTHKLWVTNFDTSATGSVATKFKAYYGDYQVEVKFGDVIRVFNIPCIKANKDSVFVLYEKDASTKGPEFISTKLLSDNSLIIIFDKPIKNESVTFGDFKFFSQTPLRIQNINVDNDNPHAIKITVQGKIVPEDYLIVSYFPGNLISTDGSKVKAFTEPVKNHKTNLVRAIVSNDGKNIEAKFNANLRNITENLGSFTINANSKPLKINNLKLNEKDSSIAIFEVSEAIFSGQTMTLSYNPGSVKDFYGFSLQTIVNVNVANESIISGIEHTDEGEFSVYPNPAQNSIQISGKSDYFSVSIINILGKLVFHGQSNSRTKSIDVTSFTRGIYIVQVIDINGNVISRKIILK